LVPRRFDVNSRVIQIVAGFTATLFFLVLSLHNLPTGTVAAHLANVDPIWVGLAMLIYVAVLLLRAWRWQIILRPVAAIPGPTVARALLVGYGLNAILPARLGELFRAEFLKRSFGMNRVAALASIVVERLFDGLTVVGCLGVGLLLAAATRQSAGILIDLLLTGSALFGLILIVILCLAGPLRSRVFVHLPRVSTQMMMVLRGFALLRTRRTAEVAAFTLIICLPDALVLWCVVKAMGLTLRFADTLVLLGAASLSTLIPSGPAFLGTMQYGYALAIEFAGGPRAVGVAAATLAQLCLLLPVALAAIAVLIHGSRNAFLAALGERQTKLTAAAP
jgi:glycosyltransferase 2 family protein